MGESWFFGDSDVATVGPRYSTGSPCPMRMNAVEYTRVCVCVLSVWDLFGGRLFNGHEPYPSIVWSKTYLCAILTFSRMAASTKRCCSRVDKVPGSNPHHLFPAIEGSKSSQTSLGDWRLGCTVRSLHSLVRHIHRRAFMLLHGMRTEGRSKR